MNLAERWIELHPKTRLMLLTLYYLAIITGLVLMYGRGNFDTPDFVYQEF